MHINGGTEFLARSPPTVEHSLLSRLLAAEKAERQDARRQGHTRPVVSAAAKKGRPSCLKGLSVKSSKHTFTPRRRLVTKTDPRASVSCMSRTGAVSGPAQQMLQQTRRQPTCLQPASVLLPTKRLLQKTTPVEGINCKKHRDINYYD